MFTEMMMSASGGGTPNLIGTYRNPSAYADVNISDLEVGKEYIVVITSGYSSSYDCVDVLSGSMTGTEGNTYTSLVRNYLQDPTYSRYTIYQVIKIKATSNTVYFKTKNNHWYAIFVIGIQ